MTVLIIEDEELAAEKLQNMILSVDEQAEIIGCTGSIEGSVKWLRQHAPPDLILMDIELSDGQSFEIFNQVEVMSPVIFTTSYDEFAIRAFQVNSIDYLLKPVLREELQRAIVKYRKLEARKEAASGASINMSLLLNELKSQMQPKEYRRRFLVKQGQKHLPIEVEEIAYFFIQERVTFFKTFNQRKFVVDYTMDELEQMMEPTHFFRINRSFMVSLKAIHQLHDYVNSRVLLSLSPTFEEQVIVSRDKAAEFKKWIGK